MVGWCETLPLRFGLRSENVEIITEPYEMYTKFLELINTSSSKIGVASLYLGNGALEKKLVSHLDDALKARPDLRVHVLLDHCRGSRGESNSRTMLLPCLTNHPGRVTISLFHTPNLTGILKQFLPDRFNELLGLQHMKLYIFDDTVMISGANLSNDYFTNRQDRCIVISNCAALSHYFYSLIETVSHFSYQLDGDNVARLHHSCIGDPTKSSGTKSFVKHATLKMQEFMTVHNKDSNSCENSDTWVYPVLQMGSFGLHQEHGMMRKLLLSADSKDKVYMSTAYFNPLEEYVDIITDQSASEYHLLTASPQANGFTPAKGIARYIPMGYRWYESSFLKRVSSCAQTHRIKLYEYTRDLWTYHSKGLWYYRQSSKLPSMTIVGSSNYGYRSVHRDLEAQMIISTTSPDLQAKLHYEKEYLYSSSELVDSTMANRIIWKYPLWTKIVSRLCRHWF